MKAQDLRLMNLVEYPNWNNDGSKAYFKIRDIYFENGKIGLTNGIIQIPSTNLEYLKPIPLTEEILANWCGAKEVKSKSGVMKCFKLHGVKLEFSMSGNTYISQSRKLIPYLHKLQNYFFEVKDIELTLNHP